MRVTYLGYCPVCGGALCEPVDRDSRDLEKAVCDVTGILERQLPQGIENAARHVVAALDEIGRD